MKPITFSSQLLIGLSPAEIADKITDLSNWPEFTGYAILPGIKKAEFERKTEDWVGTRIKVENLDGSNHVEEIYQWDLEKGLGLKLFEFSAPLSNMATHFLEEWEFAIKEDGTFVNRSFQLFPKNFLTKPFLWIISQFFRRAIKKHLSQIALEAAQT